MEKLQEKIEKNGQITAIDMDIVSSLHSFAILQVCLRTRFVRPGFSETLLVA
jgi:hypothetical protein